MFTEERFVCIYEPFDEKKGPLTIMSVALADYNKLLGTFKIKHGKYKGYTDKMFNSIKGSFELIFGHGSKVYINKVMPKDLFIYIFSNRDIKNMCLTLGYTREKTYAYIAKYLSKATLVPYNNGIIRNVYRSIGSDYALGKLSRIMFTDERIHQQLYGHQSEEEIIAIEAKEKPADEEKDNNTGEDKPIMYKIDDETQELREVNKQDLFAALPDSVKNEETKLEKDFKEEIDVISIIDEINNKIVGQEEAIKTLVTNIYYNQVLIDDLEKNNYIDSAELDSRKVNILIDGSTGTGKTAIAKLVASKFNLPLVVTNANSFSETGYVGPTITDLLKKLINQADGDVKKAERGIIILDEIDKIAVEQERGNSMKKGVQEELLTFIGGGKYDIKVHDKFGHNVTFDTSKITFVLMGAFTSIREEKEKNTNTIGFGDSTTKENTYIITPEDYIKFGLMREFFGRIKVLVSTKSYTKEDLTRILLTSTVSPLKNLEKSARLFGYGGLSYNQEFVSKIVDEAYEMKTGARSLQTVISGLQNKLLMEMITNNVSDDDKKILLNEELLDDYKKAKVIKY